MLNALYRYLGSLRCTIWLIVSLLAVFSIGFFLPQRSLVGKEAYLKWVASEPLLGKIDQALHLTEIFTAPITLALWVAFFVNLLLVMRQRIPLVLAKIKVDPEKALKTRGSSGLRYSIELDQSAQERLPETLAGLGYRFYGSTSGFLAVKNRLSPLASLLFHLSFFLLLVGWLLAFYTRFSGFVDVAQHEPFLGQISRYNVSPRLPKLGSPPQIKFKVDSVLPEVTQGVVTDIKVTFQDETGRSHEIGINRPYKSGYASVLFNDLGISPLFVLEDAAGREIDGAYVKLDVLKGKPDHFSMQGYRVDASYYPDHAVIDGKDTTRSEEFKNPAFHLEVSKGGRPVAAGTLHPGEALQLDGVRLGFREQNFWVRLLVIQEYGRDFIYAGFLMALIALGWRLIYYRRELAGVVQETDGKRILLLTAKGDFYKALAQDEFDRTVQRLRGPENSGS